jgi:hypothetical protein
MNNAIDFMREETTNGVKCEYRFTLYGNGHWDANFDWTMQNNSNGFQNFEGVWTITAQDIQCTKIHLRLSNAVVNSKYVTNERPMDYECVIEGNLRRPIRAFIQPELSVGAMFGTMNWEALERLEMGIDSLGQ